MTSVITIYVALGVFSGLGIFTLIFKKWNPLSTIKRRLRLNSRGKIVVFALVFGTLISILITLLAGYLGLSKIPKELLSGFGIGLNCAILAGLIGLDEASRAAKASTPSKRNMSRREIQRKRYKG